MPVGANRKSFAIRYVFNQIRTWWLLHVKNKNVSYNGFVRIMAGTTFAGFPVKIGHNVQFGKECKVGTPVVFGNNILMASRVCFVGRNDHAIDVPGQLIWNGKREDCGCTYVNDDVWMGHNVTVVGPLRIGRGSVIAAGAVVTRDIPECEVWGGVPARKIKDRFNTEAEKECHLSYLDSLNSK